MIQGRKPVRTHGPGLGVADARFQRGSNGLSGMGQLACVAAPPPPTGLIRVHIGGIHAA